MFLSRIYDAGLAQAGYLAGCQATGEALVVDPIRDVDQYVEAAEAEGLRVTHVTETHIHADFVSGSRELAARTGARLFLSSEGGPDWEYRWAAEAGATLLRDGDIVPVGRLRVMAMHTPGHTPEHLAFMVTDTAATDRPMGVFTGDFIFAGDVGRPDLLERAAGVAGSMDAGARSLFRSIRRFLTLPDYLQLWPGHGAGSACGKALGAVPSTTLGYERFVNWALALDDEDRFVRAVLAGQPEPPPYFATMKRTNRDGPPILGDRAPPARLDGGALLGAPAAGVLMVDVRPTDRYARAHLPGTINIPLNRSFASWAGWLVPYGRPVALLVDGGEREAERAVRELAMIGLDDIAGWAHASPAIEASLAAGRKPESIPQVNPSELAQALAAGDAVAVDVRAPGERAAGHIPGTIHLPLGQLAAQAARLPADRPLVVACQSGARSAIAASVLAAQGFTNVVNLVGGFAAWHAAGYPVADEAPEEDGSSSRAAPTSSAPMSS